MKWIQLDCLVLLFLLITSCQTKSAQVEQIKEAQMETVFLLLEQESQAEQLIPNFAKYGLQLVGRSSRSQLKYKYLYDASQIEQKAFEKLLLENSAVVEVAFVTDKPGDISTGTNGKKGKVSIGNKN